MVRILIVNLSPVFTLTIVCWCVPGIFLYLIPSNLVGICLQCVPGIIHHIKPIDLVGNYISGSDHGLQLPFTVPYYSGCIVCCWYSVRQCCIVWYRVKSRSYMPKKPSAKAQAEKLSNSKKKRKQNANIYFNSISDNNRLKRVQNAQFNRFLFVQV